MLWLNEYPKHIIFLFRRNRGEETAFPFLVMKFDCFVFLCVKVDVVQWVVHRVINMEVVEMVNCLYVCVLGVSLIIIIILGIGQRSVA